MHLLFCLDESVHQMDTSQLLFLIQKSLMISLLKLTSELFWGLLLVSKCSIVTDGIAPIKRVRKLYRKLNQKNTVKYPFLLKIELFIMKLPVKNPVNKWCDENSITYNIHASNNANTLTVWSHLIFPSYSISVLLDSVEQ